MRVIPGIGPKTAEKLDHLGISTIEQLAAAPEAVLAGGFGTSGPVVCMRSRAFSTRGGHTGAQGALGIPRGDLRYRYR